jgi:hypothetical protein
VVDTVHSVDDLLNLLFASGQPPRSITEQDVRDLIVSISLETTDLSALPRTSLGLNIGRLWIDSSKALRIITVTQPGQVVTYAGTYAGVGGLFADGRVPGRATVADGQTLLSGAGSIALTAGIARQAATGLLGGSGAVSASPVARRVASTKMDAAGALSAVATAVSKQSGNFSRAGAGSLVADGVRFSGQSWGTVAPSITKSAGNLVMTRTGSFDGNSSCGRASQFRSSGNIYWEVVMAGTASLSSVGFGNPSTDVTDGGDLQNGNNGIVYYTFSGVGGLAINGSYVQDMPPFTTTSNVGFAMRMGSGWWVRVDGGSWYGAGNGVGDPASNSNPITAFCSTTGGLGPAGEFNTSGQSQTLKIASTSWTYGAPSGFTGF